MKRIYLDQMKWVDLLKAAKGRPDGERFKDVLTIAEAAVASGRASFPISSIHYVETHKRVNWESRRDLGRLIAHLSRHHTMAPQDKLVESEIRRALYEHVGASPPRSAAPFGTGVAFAFAQDPHTFDFKLPPETAQQLPDGVAARYEARALQLLEEMMLTGVPPESEARLTAESPERDPTAHLRMTAEAAANEEQLRDVRIREGWNKGERSERVFITQAFTDNFATFHATLTELGVRHDGFYEALGRDGMTALLAQIPTLQVATEFRRQRHVASQKTIDANDANDQASLPPALVYCDVVVTERTYSRQLQGLAQSHGTVLLHDLTELSEQLLMTDDLVPSAPGVSSIAAYGSVMLTCFPLLVAGDAANA